MPRLSLVAVSGGCSSVAIAELPASGGFSDCTASDSVA